VDNIDQLTAEIRSDAGPMLKDARDALANLNRASATVGDPQQQEKIGKALQDVAQLAELANATVADTHAIVSHIKWRKGTVGAR
jgi:hypothetical protein